MSDDKQNIIRHGKYRTPNGDIFWYENGKLHKEGEPAVIHTDGSTRWYVNGKKHRDDGPAIERGNMSNRSNRWFLDDVEYTEEEFKIYLVKKKLNEALQTELISESIKSKVKI